MKLAVMQPYFFPYIGYFSLIQSVDRFMFFDDVQYIRKSWMGRNRLLNIEKNEPYYIRPDIVKPNYQALFPTVKLEQNDQWKIKIFEQIKGYKNKAPYYKETLVLLEKIFEKEYENLVDFNCSSIMEISNWLNLRVQFDKYTNHNFWFSEKPDPGTWGFEISKELKATSYINSSGGESFIFHEDFTKAGIKLGFIQPELKKYNQQNDEFITGLSIIDVLLFNGKENTSRLVQNYSIKWKN